MCAFLQELLFQFGQVKKKKKGILVKSVDRFNKFGSIYFVSSKLFEVGGVVLLTPKYFIIFLQ